MTASAKFPTSTVSFGQVTETGDGRAQIARDVEAIAARTGIMKATAGATRIAPAGGTTTLYLSGGTLRTIATVAIATGMTLAISSVGAVQGQRFMIIKTATGGTGAVVIDGISHTTHKRFGAELVFTNGTWRMLASVQFA